MRNDVMEVDLRKHPGIRQQVYDGIIALRVQGRQIWGDEKLTLGKIVNRLMVGVGDLARLDRDFPEWSGPPMILSVHASNELKKELGNIVFSTIRWIDDLGLDPMECLELAINAQEKFANSGRPR